ncbi:hypothetical protein NN561_012484 [Cricetulus griseus]
MALPRTRERASAGAGQRPAASTERPSRRRGPPRVRLFAPPPVSSGGGSRLPLPAGSSPSVGEAVCPPRGALPTCPAPHPHTAAEPLFPVGRPSPGSWSHSPSPSLARWIAFCRSGTDGPQCPP